MSVNDSLDHQGRDARAYREAFRSTLLLTRGIDTSARDFKKEVMAGHMTKLVALNNKNFQGQIY
ncbi:MAG: hypothetical protein P8X46_10990 [Nitrospirales bacterium]